MNQADILLLAGLRVDGRKSDDIRSIRMKCNPLSHVDGSCYMEQVIAIPSLMNGEKYSFTA